MISNASGSVNYRSLFPLPSRLTDVCFGGGGVGQRWTPGTIDGREINGTIWLNACTIVPQASHHQMLCLMSMRLRLQLGQGVVIVRLL